MILSAPCILTVGKHAMAWKNAISRSAARVVAVLAVVLAVAGGLWSLGKANLRSPVAASCGGFDSAARKLLTDGATASSGSAALNATFARGDRVHFAIESLDDYAWELTGVLANIQKSDLQGYGAMIYTKTIRSDTDIKFIPYTRSTTIHVVNGTVKGTGRLELDIDAAKAGAGGIIITKSGSATSSTPPSVASATCNAATPTKPGQVRLARSS
jgi:hypothetical protein